jgi:hypothetical protein
MNFPQSRPTKNTPGLGPENHYSAVGIVILFQRAGVMREVKGDYSAQNICG